MSSGIASRLLSSCSIDLSPSSGCLSIAPFRLVTYVAWCRSWWISIVRASMWGSSASKLYGSGGSTKAIAILLAGSNVLLRRGRPLPAALVPHGLDGGGRGLRIEVPAPPPPRPPVAVQPVQERHPGWGCPVRDLRCRAPVHEPC